MRHVAVVAPAMTLLVLAAPPAASVQDARVADEPAPSGTGDAMPSGFDVVQRSLEAAGPAAQRAAIRNVRHVMTVEAGGLTSTVTVHADRSRGVLLVARVPGESPFVAGHDGVTGWSVDPVHGARVLCPDDAEDLLFERDMVLPPAVPARAENLGPTVIDGQDAWKVVVDTRRGGRMTAYYDRATGHAIALLVAKCPPMARAPVTISLSDHRDFAGIVLPGRSVTRLGRPAAALRAPVQSIVTVQSVDWNLPQLPSFAPPSEVLELLTGQPYAAWCESP